jgi:hypothetical protein
LSNTNTIVRLVGATAAVSTTSAQAFLVGTAPAFLSVPPNWYLSGVPFQIRLAGNFQSLNATSVTVLPAIYLGTSSATTTGIIVPAAVSTNLASQLSGNFLIDAEMLYDVTSTSLQGNYSVQIGPAATTTGFVTSTKSTSITAITQGNGGTTGLNFMPFFTFSASSTNNIATITDFSISIN